MSKNVIITLASNYTFNDLRIFMNSLNKTGFKGVLFLIVNNTVNFSINELNYSIEQLIVKDLKFDSVRYKVGLKENIDKFKRRKVTKRLLKNLEIKDFTDEKLLFNFVKFYHCQVSRYALYLIILLRNDFTNVFLSDSRDIYFQFDPFINREEGLHIFQENKKFAIKDRWYNNQWVKISTNFFNYLKIRNKGIFCSGTILGDTDNMISFLKLFLFSTLDKNLPFDVKGLDQGLFNVLIHNNKLKNYQAHDDQKIVLTLSAMGASEFSFDETLIYNSNGISPSVVHQFDRHESLITFINNRY